MYVMCPHHAYKKVGCSLSEVKGGAFILKGGGPKVKEGAAPRYVALASTLARRVLKNPLTAR